MAKKIVYFGPINNDFKENLIDKAREYLKKNMGYKFYYMLPSGNLLTRYREMLLKDLKGVFDINVITFDDIVSKMLKRELCIRIDDAAKETIISNILKELHKEGKLHYYKDLVDAQGFTTSLGYIIGQIKRSLICPEDFNSNIPDNPRYTEIGLIYEKYQEFLHLKNLLDKEEEFIKALDILKSDGQLFKELDFIIIDEFFDFRPMELEILRLMTSGSMDIYINIPYRTKKNWETTNRTLSILKDMGFEIEILEKPQKNYFERLSEDIFTTNEPIYEKNERLRLIKAPNRYLEVKKVSQEIKSLTNKGIKLSDIGIVVPDLDKYRDVLLKVFREEKIPSTISEEVKLIDVPLVREIVNILEMRLNNFQKTDLIKGLKSGYLNICDGNNRDRLEYILHSLKVRDIEGEFKDIVDREKLRLRFLMKNSEDKKEVYEERLEDMVNLEFVVDTLMEKVKEIPLTAEAEKLSRILLDITKYYNLEDKIKEIYRETKDYLLLHRDTLTLSKLKQILGKVEGIAKIAYGDEQIELRDFYNILIRLLKDEGIITSLGSRMGVSILTPSTARGLKFSALFVVGLAQGQYPCINSRNWFFREEDYQLFKDIGLDVKSYSEMLDKECLLFNVVLTRAEEFITLSYSDGENGDEVSIPSMFLDELLSLFRGEKIEDKIDYKVINMDYIIKEKIQDITCDRELIRHLLYRYYSGDDITEYLEMANSQYEKELSEILERIECEAKRNEDKFNEYDGVITDEKVSSDILQSYSNSKFSITQLETYGKCPFRFLYEHVLMVEAIDREIEEFSPVDRGSLYHEVLAVYYQNHRDDFRKDIVEGKGFIVEDTRDEIIQLIKNALKNIGITTLNRMWHLRIEHIANTVINVINKDMERLRNYKEKLLPYEFEVKFGYERDFIVKVGDREIKLLGKIDRIDVLENQNVYIVYDYKHSPYGVKSVKDIQAGVSFQLPVYILSQIDKERQTVGGGYIVIKDGDVNIQIVKEKYKSIVGRSRGNSVLSDQDWDNIMDEVKTKIKDYVEKIYTGDFRLNPLECDQYCPLSSMCRYEFDRIARKGDDYGTHQ